MTVDTRAPVRLIQLDGRTWMRTLAVPEGAEFPRSLDFQAPGHRARRFVRTVDRYNGALIYREEEGTEE